MKDNKEPDKKLGRPRHPQEDVPVNETTQERLDMTDSSNPNSEEYISIDDLTRRWRNTFQKIAAFNGAPGIGTVAAKWNKLNPFLQNQRIKELYTRAKTYSKANIGDFLADPGNHEKELRSLGWANSSSQQIYYNILRRACDIPEYNYFILPELHKDAYSRGDFRDEDALVQNWLETFNVPLTCKTIALEVKREGKSSYLLRNKFSGQGKTKTTAFCALQKMPTDWIKITGKGQLGFTISFDMMYFLNIANSPSDFGEFMEAAWHDIVENGVVVSDTSGKYELNLEVAANYVFHYAGDDYRSTIESVRRGRQQNYMFWLRMPYDLCYTFGSDNSHPWVAPDTMGLMLKL